MAAITKGITISFANTPQAGDDLFTGTDLTEDNLDSLGTVYLDVMGNDLGGNAKTLYSLDDGISAVSYTNPQGGTSPTDLLAQDAREHENKGVNALRNKGVNTEQRGQRFTLQPHEKKGVNALPYSHSIRIGPC